MITASPQPQDNNKMTFNNGFLVEGNGGQRGVSHGMRQEMICYYLFLGVAVTEGLYCQARDFRLNPDVLLANSGSFLSEYSASVT